MSVFTGTPSACSLTPYSPSSSRCPAAVAPPWLPIAATTNGFAPRSRRKSSVARTMVLRLAMPRLPVATATLVAAAHPAGEARGGPLPANFGGDVLDNGLRGGLT